MNKPEVTLVRKNSLRQHEVEILRGTRLRMTLDSGILNHYFFTTVYDGVKQYQVC